MNFKFKNLPIHHNFKQFYSELYTLLFVSLRSILNKYLDSNICVIKEGIEVVLNLDLLFFKITNLNSNNIDSIQELNPKIIVYIPCTITNKFAGVTITVNYLLGEFPIYSINKTLIINGLHKVFISKLILDNKGLFFNTFVKNNKQIHYAKLIIDPNFKLNVVLEDNNCYIVINSTIKYNLIHFLYALGLTSTDILNSSKYNTSYCLKQILLYSSTQHIPESDQINDLFMLIYYLNNSYILDSCNLINNINVSNKIKQTLTVYNWNKLIGEDFILIVDTLLDIKFKKKNIKNLYHLENRSIYTINDFYRDHFLKFISLNAYKIKEDICQYVVLNISNLKKSNTKIVRSKVYFNLKEYITMNPLVQYTDQINSLSEITHKNRIINYTSKTQQTLSARDISLNQLGSLCLIDTTEGINCGLVLSFTKHIKISSNRAMLFPYSFAPEYKSKQNPKFLNLFNKETYHVVFNNYYLRKNKLFNHTNLTLTKGDFQIKNTNVNNTVYIKPQNLFSYPQNLIPFIFYNDPTRCLMAAKMQAQSVPTIKQTKPYILTGYEKECILNTDTVLRALQEGIVSYVSSYKIIIRDIFNRTITYYLNKYKKSNQNTIINQTPIVWVGERVLAGQILTNTQDIIDSESVVGNNLLISYGNFFGYNFEDALVINKRVVYKQLFTSLHFSVYETTFNIINNNYLEVPSVNLPKKSLIHTKNLDNLGFIREGSKVLNNDVLISKLVITPIDISLLPVYPLIQHFFGEQIRDIKDTSIVVPFGDSGRVVKTEIFSNYNLKYSNQYLKCRVYICKQRLLSVGDKLCGRHGNKGVIAYISANNELPYTNRSLIPDIITDALGIPSRLNQGQLFESLLGLSCFMRNTRICVSNSFITPSIYYKTFIYDTLKNLSIQKGIKHAYNSYIPGKILLRDGRTGCRLAEPSFIGVAKYSKLIHMIKDKVHYRVIGPYTEVMQQPVKGRTNSGGQRFGEMEVWALEAYGAAYNLRELLNYKSDDLAARESVQDMLINNKHLAENNTTEAFKLLLKELNGLSLNIDATATIDKLSCINLPLNINF